MKYVKNYEYVAPKMHSLEIDQQYFLVDLLLPSQPAICDEEESRLALQLAMAKYFMQNQNLK